MRNRHRAVILTALLAASTAAPAHHSFAPHFDADRPVEISGRITEYEQRNPHAYLHVAAVDENGLSREYVCESHGVTQLARNGITPDMLTAGTAVTLTGSQARRDPYMCFFNTIEFSDGRLLNVNGSRTTAAPTSTEPRSEIYGRWLLERRNSSTSGPQPMMDYLTAAGRAATEQYDPFVDDPTFRCDPVAIRRVWGAPSTPLAISGDGDRVILRHEWMDVERIVHLDRTSHPVNGPRSSLGHSIGRFEGDALVIETANYSAGVLSQYVETPGQPTRGLLHSDTLTSVERLTVDPATSRLTVEITLDDPAFYTEDFDPVSYLYAPTELELQPFNCRPENADHSLID
jgi:hypothetical protein